MNTLGKISWLVSLLAISSVTACGSDDDGDGGGDGGGALDSGVDQDKPGEDLTEDEIEAVCEAQYDYAESKVSDADMAKAMCRLVALSAALSVGGDDAAMTEMCEMVDEACNDCRDDPDGDGCDAYADLEEPENDCSETEVPDDCSSTVGEVEACFKAQVDQFSAIIGDLPSCSEISADSEPPDLEAEIEECETVEENCPEALE